MMTTKNICPKCGTIADAVSGSRFCLECGADLRVTDDELKAEEERKRKEVEEELRRAEERKRREAEAERKRKEEAAAKADKSKREESAAEKERKREAAAAEAQARTRARYEARAAGKAKPAKEARPASEANVAGRAKEESNRPETGAAAKPQKGSDRETPGVQAAMGHSGRGYVITCMLIGIAVLIGVFTIAVVDVLSDGSGSASSGSAQSAASASAAASSQSSHTTASSSAAQSTTGSSVTTQSTMGSNTDGEGIPYKNEYFELMLPSAWDGAWEVYRTEETREAMNATNYAYHFKYDKMAQFTVRCALFNLDGDARIGSSSSGYQIEFHPAEFMDAGDKTFVRSSIKLR